jgi:hypothetical protein
MGDTGDRLRLREAVVGFQDQLVAAALDQPRPRGIGTQHGLRELGEPRGHAVDVERAAERARRFSQQRDVGRDASTHGGPASRGRH